MRYRTTPAQVEALLAPPPEHPGRRKLRAILRGDVKVVLSKLEKGFLALLRGDRLDLPETNRPRARTASTAGGRSTALTVELDSYRFHNSRYAWEQDRKREREAAGAAATSSGRYTLG